LTAQVGQRIGSSGSRSISVNFQHRSYKRIVRVVCFVATLTLAAGASTAAQTKSPGLVGEGRPENFRISGTTIPAAETFVTAFRAVRFFLVGTARRFT